MRNMRASVIACFALLMALAGCSEDTGPTVAIAPGANTVGHWSQPGKIESVVLINDFEVSFDGYSMLNGNTVFTWTVRGTGVEPALSVFAVQLPDCAPEPLSFSPGDSVSIDTDPDTGIYGVEWHLQIEPGDTLGRQYSLTFPGDVPLGEVYSAVTSGSETGVGIIPGPCQGYDISGRVFVDIDENGLRDSDQEPGIADVIVEFVDVHGNVTSVVTDESGSYAFRKLGGTFQINLPLDGYPGYFNEDLARSFDATTSLTLEATVPPDSPNNDFGFSPQSEELISELEDGILLSTGESLEFWTDKFASAVDNDNGHHDFDAGNLVNLLTELQGLFLVDPYQFTPGNELREAYDILRSDSLDVIDRLFAELLATELNQVAGYGLVDQRDLQLVLISWGEALIAAYLAPETAKTDAGGEKAPPSNDIIHEATILFGLLNTGGGGGIDE